MKYTVKQVQDVIACRTNCLAMLNESATNKAVDRRIKLFGDAEHYGAQLLHNNGYIACICKDYSQTHVFGRAKPKVDQNGIIIQQANLRDDEGITDDNKRIRDSDAHPYIKDGLGFDDQPFEAGWCVMGGNNAYYNSTIAWGPDLTPCGSYQHIGEYCQGKKPGDVCPLIVIMELHTGKLYITNARYEGEHGGGMLNLGNGWAIDDFNCERNGFNEGGIAKRILIDEDFADIVQKSLDKSFDGIQDRPTFDVVQCAKSTSKTNKTNFSTISSFCEKLSKFIEDKGISHVAMDQLPIKIAIDKQVRCVNALKEGRGSCLVLDVSDKQKITLLDLATYIKQRKNDDVGFMQKNIIVNFNSMETNVGKDPWIDYVDNCIVLFI